MPITLDATIRSATANSYVSSVAAADTYATELAAIARLGLSLTGWNAATSDQKARALVTAADSLDSLVFPGVRETTDQSREWPRVRTGLSRIDAVLPEGLLLAQVAEAVSLLSTPNKIESAAAAGVESESFGGKSLSFNPSKAKEFRPSTLVSKAATDLLAMSRLLPPPGAGSAYVGRG